MVTRRTEPRRNIRLQREYTTYFHIAEIWDWSSQRDGATYTPQAYTHEGFIHLSYEGSGATAGRYFLKRDDIVVLKIESADLDGEVVDENLLGGEELFPHLYAPLNVSAVTAVGAVPGQWTTTSVRGQLVAPSGG